MSSLRLSALLAGAAATGPATPALTGGPDGRVTHAELAALAGRVQSGLRELGVREGDRVMLLTARTGARPVAAMHAILAAGAVYVPLDPASPPARWAAVARVCSPAAVVGDRELLDLFARAVPLPRRLALTPGPAPAGGPDPGRLEWDDLAPAELTPVAADGRRIAYLLPTSGSTGVPKCVAHTGEGALAFLTWMNAELGLRPTDVFACHAPLHFDVAVATLLGSALAGAAAAPVPRELSGFGAELAEWIAERGITVWLSVPYPLARLSALEPVRARERLASLRTVVFAGDVFPHQRLAALMARAPLARFINFYGPTETNGCTFEVVTEPPTGPVPIGRAAGPAACWVEDGGKRVETVGAEGELVVAGPAVAAGYWGAPERDGSRFRFGASYPGGRAYATGDRVRVLPGRRYAFLGRTDNMIKMRGQRFELEEVESVLRRHPGVAECCVVKVDVRDDYSRLTAVVVATGTGMDVGTSTSTSAGTGTGTSTGTGTGTEEAAGAGALRDHCRARLPSWAVPHRFVAVPALPLGSTGKVDRRRVERELRAGRA
ncbi:amino acid adenylation domain-containing protein [Streptomyces sp. CAU 1734]|uniref:amino acid adenylation domain-containing protein n=1 Tax=Streptomyces sp. CAU 1734 TaxID=3140360 RepID=UPI003260E549